MQRMIATIWKTLLLSAIGMGIGFTINSMSEKPLPLVRVPASATAEQWTVLDTQTVQRHLEAGTAIFIDAREPKEFKVGHIPGALNLPAEQFGEYFEKLGSGLPKEEAPLIVYCQGGVCDESHRVLEHLKTLEFKNLYLFTGGWQEWQKNNLPVEK